MNSLKTQSSKQDLQKYVARMHLDAELMYIAQESWSLAVDRLKDERGYVRLKPLFIEVGCAITETIADRQGVATDLNRKLTPDEVCNIMMQWNELNKNASFNFENTVYGCMEKLVELALARSVLPIAQYDADYWPEMKAWGILQQ